MSDWPEWFCTKCYLVAQCKRPMKCCGPVESFDPTTHANRLVSQSNAWRKVWQKWEHHPLLQEVATELADEGCWGAGSALNEFIERLVKKAEANTPNHTRELRKTE